jgi:inner-membrane translocator
MALGGVIPMLADRLDHKRAQKAKEEEAKLAVQVSDASDPSQEEANNAH